MSSRFAHLWDPFEDTSPTLNGTKGIKLKGLDDSDESGNGSGSGSGSSGDSPSLIDSPKSSSQSQVSSPSDLLFRYNGKVNQKKVKAMSLPLNLTFEKPEGSNGEPDDDGGVDMSSSSTSGSLDTETTSDGNDLGGTENNGSHEVEDSIPLTFTPRIEGQFNMLSLEDEVDEAAVDGGISLGLESDEQLNTSPDSGSSKASSVSSLPPDAALFRHWSDAPALYCGLPKTPPPQFVRERENGCDGLGGFGAYRQNVDYGGQNILPNEHLRGLSLTGLDGPHMASTPFAYTHELDEHFRNHNNSLSPECFNTSFSGSTSDVSHHYYNGSPENFNSSSPWRTSNGSSGNGRSPNSDGFRRKAVECIQLLNEIPLTEDVGSPIQRAQTNVLTTALRTHLLNQLREAAQNSRDSSHSPQEVDSPKNDWSLESAAKFHRGIASNGYSEASFTWSGTLPVRPHRNPVYSSKVFVGGVPWDISEAAMISSFRLFGNVKVEWPGSHGGAAQPKGYVYVIFENDKQVKLLLQSCTHDYSKGGNWYYRVSSKRMKQKDVQIIPWAIGDSNFVRCQSPKLDPEKTIFVGALHGMLNAEGLATIMNDLFGSVVYAGIDTDRNKYPIGSGRVTFSSHRAYMKAVSAAFVEIRTSKFTKKVQVDPYLQDSTCSVCSLQQGPYFCRDLSCFRYFCKTCFQNYHRGDGFRSHRPLMRNALRPGVVSTVMPGCVAWNFFHCPWGPNSNGQGPRGGPRGGFLNQNHHQDNNHHNSNGSMNGIMGHSPGNLNLPHQF